MCAAIPLRSGYPHELDLSRDRAFCFFEERAKPETGLADRRCVGLNMNYSFIFTEISFYSETLILLQIIHMTIWIMPEFDREV